MKNESAVPLRNIQNRRDMNEHFENSMRRAYVDLKERQKQEYEENLVKSYLVEYHSKIKNNHDSLFRSLRDMKGIVTEVQETQDPTLAYISGKTVDFLVDILDDRFFILHTLSKSTDTDEFLRKFVSSSVAFDRSWFTVQVLENLASFSVPDGWEARFSPTEIDESDQELADKLTNQKPTTSISLSRIDAWEKYLALKRSDLIPELPLDVLRLRRYQNGNLARCRVTSDGKVTARGNSFQEYQNLLTIIQKTYSKFILFLEEEYSLHYESFNKGVQLGGRPFLIQFSRTIYGNEMKWLLHNMSKGTLPLKLLGLVEKKGNGNYSLSSIDLHVACRVFFDISPEFIRAYLPKGSCANSLLRLVRYIQHHVDANVIMRIGDDIH